MSLQGATKPVSYASGTGVIAERNGYSKVEIRSGIVDNYMIHYIEKTFQ